MQKFRIKEKCLKDAYDKHI